MKILKLIIAGFLTIGLLGSIINFFQQIGAYEASDIVGHLLAIGIFIFLIYLLLKPSKNTKENFKIKSDGYYIGSHSEISNYDNKPFVFYIIMVFSEKGKVYLNTPENLNDWKKNNTNEELKEFIVDINNSSEDSCSDYETNYKVSDGKVLMRFLHPEGVIDEEVTYSQGTYDEYEGIIIKNGLVLSLHRRLLNYEGGGGYRKPTILKNIKFDFVKI